MPFSETESRIHHRPNLAGAASQQTINEDLLRFFVLVPLKGLQS